LRWPSGPDGVSLTVDQRSSSVAVNSAGTSLTGTLPNAKLFTKISTGSTNFWAYVVKPPRQTAAWGPGCMKQKKAIGGWPDRRMTLGNIRANGVWSLDGSCSVPSADRWPDTCWCRTAPKDKPKLAQERPPSLACAVFRRGARSRAHQRGCQRLLRSQQTCPPPKPRPVVLWLQ
jgi:hypothetical protein